MARALEQHAQAAAPLDDEATVACGQGRVFQAPIALEPGIAKVVDAFDSLVETFSGGAIKDFSQQSGALAVVGDAIARPARRINR